MSEYLSIGQLAKKAKVQISTIRYYERVGIIPEPIRSYSGYRQYPEETIALIKFIKNSQELSFSLKEIQSLLSWQQSPDLYKGNAKALVRNKIRDLSKQFDQLKQKKHTLKKLELLCPITKNGGNCKAHRCKVKNCPLISHLHNNCISE